MRLSAPIFRLKQQAKALARASNAPLHQALDGIARREGYRSWSHLSKSSPGHRPTRRLLAELSAGDLVLLGARPGQGKTLLGLGLAAEAAQAGRRGYFFSLESNRAAIFERLRALRMTEAAEGDLVIDTSDEICARYIAHAVRGEQTASVITIDYLQILDQKRSDPELNVQLRELANLAHTTSSIVVAISQIDRSFELKNQRLPQLSDVRLPNPVDLGLFTKTCFLHAGEVRVEALL